MCFATPVVYVTEDPQNIQPSLYTFVYESHFDVLVFNNRLNWIINI